MRDALIVGAGVGGLAAAIRLAGNGWRVRVLEKGAGPGGKMGELRANGYRWDTGPSVVTLRPVLEQLFRDAGRDLRDYLDLQPVHPITRYFWPDGATLDAVQDPDAMRANIRAAGFDPRDIDGYTRFMRYARQLHATVSAPFLYRAQPSLRDLLRLPLLDVLRIDALRSMHAAVRAHFRDPHLVQLFDRFATYNGSSPFAAPATLNVIAHVEMGLGAWYPRGGVYKIALALERLARELGVDLAYNQTVTHIDTRGGTARAVRTHATTLTASIVLCNADYAFAQAELIDPAQARRSPLAPSSSACVALAQATSANPSLAHHNIFFCKPAAYQAEFDDIFARQVAPLNPTIYLCITSKTDPDHAPPGSENWFALANAPYLSAHYDWSREAEPYAKSMLATLAERIGCPTPSPAHIITPADIQQRYNGNRGALYGFSSNTRAAAFARPGNRSPTIRGLYYAGGSTHPGGGVPLVILSGIAAANSAISDATSRTDPRNQAS